MVKRMKEMWTKVMSRIAKAGMFFKKANAFDFTNMHQMSGRIPLQNQIKFKLILAFSIPVILIISSGLFTYQKAKSSAIENYEISTLGNMQNSALYCQLLMADIEAKASQLSSYNDFITYYNRFSSNSVMDSNTFLSNSKSTLSTLTMSSVGIYNAYAFGKAGNPISSLSSAPKDTLYQNFVDSEEKKVWDSYVNREKGFGAAWIGHHPTVDGEVNGSAEYYVASYVREFSKGEGYIVFDLLKSKVMEVLHNSVVSDNSIVGFITADGRETRVVGSNSKEEIGAEKIFVGQEFYTTTLAGEEVSGYENIRTGKANYLFVYSKIGTTGAVIATLVPNSDILKQVEAIKVATIVFVALASIIAIAIGLYLATDFGRVIHKFSLAFKEVAKGDFTTRVTLSRKDEFGTLADHMNGMVHGIRALVGDMAVFGKSVSGTAKNVSDASGQILKSITEVSETVIDMEQGVNEQVDDTERSYKQMNNFAKQIGDIYDESKEVGSVANSTQLIVNDGKNIIQTLIEQVSATADITNVIIRDIDELERQSKSIGSVVETIDEIASTTNLLSLNASIEAARAGDAGRGFAVVAEQIRYLAEQSVESVQRIEVIIKAIQQKTKTTAASANQAEDMLVRQTKALNNTVQVFQNVDLHMVALMDKIDHIIGDMQSITETKDTVLRSIKNIAVVTEQTATATAEVEATVGDQITSVEDLNRLAEEMKLKANDLELAIRKLII